MANSDAVTPRHYATHAAAALEWSVAKYESRGYPKHSHEPNDVITSLMTIRMRESLYWLHRSIKFIGPDGGQFIDRINLVGDADDGVDFPRLPYGAICLEIALRLTSCADYLPERALADDLMERQPDRACILAFYPDVDSPLCRLALNTYGQCTRGEFIVTAIFGFPGIRHGNGDAVCWCPTTFGVLVTPRPQVCGTVFSRTDGAKRIGLVPLTTRADDRAVSTSLRARGIEAPDYAARTSAVNDLANEALAIAELCNVLTCTNVSTETICAPTKINKARARRGKLPFYEYKTLVIHENSHHRVAGLGGTHSAPRLHYRRGHIRRLSGGRKTWVRPSMVGDRTRGFVDKDYNVKPFARESTP